MPPLPPDLQRRLDARLLRAAEDRSAETVLDLIRQGADVNGRARDTGFIPLHAAAAKGNLPVIRLLLECGADPCAADNHGNTPLMYAAHQGRADSISCLLAAVPDYPLDTANREGKNALTLAVIPPYHENAAIRLLDAGSDPHAEAWNRSGEVLTPYDTATIHQNGDALHLMNQYDMNQLPPLADATRANTLGPHSILLKHPHGWRHFGFIAEKLAEQGAPITKADLLAPYHGDRTLLARAAECNRLATAVRHLNAHGESLTPEDLLTPGGKPDTLLETCIERQCLHALMTHDNWKTQSPDDLKRVWHALPQDAQAQVRNYRSLYAELCRNQPQIGRGR